PQLPSGYEAPRTPAEATLANIWQELLRVEQVGVNDNFFELGGDSILSIRIIARANQAGLRLTPKQVFQHQTIASLAAVAGSGPAVSAEQGLVTGEVPLTPIQRWFCERELEERHHYNQARMLVLRGGITAEQVKEAFAGLVAYHDALRLRFM